MIPICLAQFFGDLSTFQIIVSALAAFAAFLSLPTFYKTFIERVKLSLYPGDAVRIVLSPDGDTSAFHLMCNLINKTTKAGTVHRLEVRVSDPQKATRNFVWYLFYKYSPGGQGVEKEIDPYPVAVSPKDSKLIFVGFQADLAEQKCTWPEGEYKFEVIGWVNRKHRRKSSNLKSIFHTQITEEVIRQLGKPNPNNPIYITVPVIEWERRHG